MAPNAPATANPSYDPADHGPSQEQVPCYGEGSFPPPRPFERSRYSRAAYEPSRAAVYAGEQPHGLRQALERAMVLLVAVGCIITLAAVLLLFFYPGPFGGSAGAQEPTVSAGASAAESQPSSTPAALWRKGQMPNLYQTDPQWASRPYGDGTIATHGCGPTCLSMVYVALTGNRDLDPAAMAAYSEDAGYIDSGVTSWLLMSEGARNLGIGGEELCASESVVRGALSQGRPVIASVGPGDFTDDGHFIVISGANSDGTVKVHDPNSPQRSADHWDLADILAQCRNLWAY